MVKQNKLEMVFLIKTKLHIVNMEWVRVQLGFDNMFVMDCVRHSEGLALLWMTHIGVEQKKFQESAH